MPRANGVFGQEQRACVWVPDGESPISNQLTEAAAAPLFVSSSGDLNLRGVNADSHPQLPDKLGPVVHAAVPREDGSRCGDVRLCFAAGFLPGGGCGVKDGRASPGIGTPVLPLLQNDVG